MVRVNFCWISIYIILLTFHVITSVSGANISVDAHTGIVLNEQPNISNRLFGFTAFEGFANTIADRDYRAKLGALRPGCFRFPGVVEWFSPKTFDLDWYKSDQAAKDFEQSLLFGARYNMGSYLPIVRELNAEPMCSLQSPPKYLQYNGTSRPSNFDQWARMCTAYLGLWKKYDPDLRYVQVWNEPNADWFKDARIDPKNGGDSALFIKMANKVARAVKAKYPDIKMGGPVLCWMPAYPPQQEGQQPYYTWQNWTLPWLKATKDTYDFFDFHIYNILPEDLIVQVEMLHNQALLTQGRHLPVWITESNYDLKPEELNDPKAIWHSRMLPYERLLLNGMLPQSDKIDGNLCHDLGNRLYCLMPGGNSEVNPMYWLFWILRDLRGTRVSANSDTNNLHTYAVMEKDRVTTIMFNDTPQALETVVDVSMPCGYWTGPDVRAICESDNGTCEIKQVPVETERKGSSAHCRLNIPAYGTVNLDFHMDNFGKLAKSISKTEQFGDRTFVPIKYGGQSWINIKSVSGSNPALRLGLLGATGSERLKCRINGREISLKSRSIQEIQLAKTDIRLNNKIEVYLVEPSNNPRLVLAFSSIVSEKTDRTK